MMGVLRFLTVGTNRILTEAESIEEATALSITVSPGLSVQSFRCYLYRFTGTTCMETPHRSVPS